MAWGEKYAEQRRAYNREYYKIWTKRQPKTYTRNRYLRHRYGLTEQQVRDMLTTQGGGCAICKREVVLFTGKTGAHIDHDHVTKKIRGILCSGCNRMLGCAQDDPAVLAAGVEYLRR
jgi:hypothetical protein